MAGKKKNKKREEFIEDIDDFDDIGDMDDMDDIEEAVREIYDDDLSFKGSPDKKNGKRKAVQVRRC